MPKLSTAFGFGKRTSISSYTCRRCRLQGRALSTDVESKPSDEVIPSSKSAPSNQEEDKMPTDDELIAPEELQNVSPESLRFIEIPTTLQPDAVKPGPSRGVLPVPRRIFARKGPARTSSVYFEQTTAEPKKIRESPEAQHRARAAEYRRQNLRSGLTELQNRMEEANAIKSKRRARNIATRREAALAPDPDYEQYTNSTVLAALTKKQRGPLPDPGRAERIAASRLRTQKWEEAKVEKRRKALHTLYMQARNFITTEEQLTKEIDKHFVDLPFRRFAKFQSHSYDGSNIWATGPPTTIDNRMRDLRTIQNRRADLRVIERSLNLHRDRLRKIASELTGGERDTATRQQDSSLL